MKHHAASFSHLRYLLLLGVVLCLFVSTTVSAEWITHLEQPEGGAIELADPLEMEDLSVAENAPYTGEIHLPSVAAKDITETPVEGARKFKDRYTVCSKTVDKGCVIVGLTETRK